MSDFVSATSWYTPHEVKYTLVVWLGLFLLLRRCESNLSGCWQGVKDALQSGICLTGVIPCHHICGYKINSYINYLTSLRHSLHKMETVELCILLGLFHIYHLLILHTKHYRILQVICNRAIRPHTWHTGISRIQFLHDCNGINNN